MEVKESLYTIVMTLIIRDVRPDDIRNYTCVARNSKGSAKGTIALQRESPKMQKNDEFHLDMFHSLSCWAVTEFLLAELYVPPLPTSAPLPTFRTRNEVHGRSGEGQERGSGRKAFREPKTNEMGRETTPSDKMFGGRGVEADNEEEPDYVERSTDPGSSVSDWGDFEYSYGESLTFSPAIGIAGLMTLISVHFSLLS